MASWKQAAPDHDEGEDLLGPIAQPGKTTRLWQAMTHETFEEPRTDAPTFVEARVLPGSRVFRLSVPPLAAFRSMVSFFGQRPAQLRKVETGAEESRPWRLGADAFFNYVPVSVEIAVFAVGVAEVAVILKMEEEADVVNFSRLAAAFVVGKKRNHPESQMLPSWTSSRRICSKTRTKRPGASALAMWLRILSPLRCPRMAGPKLMWPSRHLPAGQGTQTVTRLWWKLSHLRKGCCCCRSLL